MKEGNFEQFGEAKELAERISDVKLQVNEMAEIGSVGVPEKTFFHNAINGCDKWLEKLQEEAGDEAVDPLLLEAILQVKEEYTKKFEEETS